MVQVLSDLPKFTDPNILIDQTSLDDAGVYKIDAHRALIFTVDILTPIVDDPYVFGEIATANSLSDIYAMGGDPLIALNIAGFPPEADVSILKEIIKGSIHKAKEAGVKILGGHTIKDEGVKYGLAVIGIVKPDKVITISGAKPGDKLLLTKPIGTGIISTSAKMEMATQISLNQIIDSMCRLNNKAKDAMQKIEVNACTDITGFGLLGHSLEMARSSKVSLNIYGNKVPIFKDAIKYVNKGIFPPGSQSNFEYIHPYARFDTQVNESYQKLLCDAQTSGGLLISIPSSKVEHFCKLVPEALIIGEVIKKGKFPLYIGW